MKCYEEADKINREIDKILISNKLDTVTEDSEFREWMIFTRTIKTTLNIIERAVERKREEINQINSSLNGERGEI